MPLFHREPRLLPLQLPRLDGSTWPDRREVGRTSFAAVTLYEMGYREAFEPEAHHIADMLLGEVLPHVRAHATPEDAPYLRRVFISAAQIGAGIGIVERRAARPDERSIDRQAGGALWVASGDLPAMPEHQRRVARYLLQSGHYVARTHPETIPLLVAGLSSEDERGGN